MQACTPTTMAATGANPSAAVAAQQMAAYVAALTAASSNGSMVSGTIQMAQPSISCGGADLFVHNLAPETEESILWRLFGPFGAILSVKVNPSDSSFHSFI